MNTLETIKQQATDRLTALRGQARYRDCVPERLVHVWVLLESLVRTQNPYRVTNIFGEQYLSKDCYGFLMETVDCDPKELNSYIEYLEDTGMVLIGDIAAFDGKDYIEVVQAPTLGNIDE